MSLWSKMFKRVSKGNFTVVKEENDENRWIDIQIPLNKKRHLNIELNFKEGGNNLDSVISYIEKTKQDE